MSRVKGSEGEVWTESKYNCRKEAAFLFVCFGFDFVFVFPKQPPGTFPSVLPEKLKSFLRRNMCVCICVYMWAMLDPEILNTDKLDMKRRGEI